MDTVEQWRRNMLDGDFEAAWRISDRVRPAVWDGTPMTGKDVLVQCLHGLGDTIFFARYLAALAKLARRVTVAPQAELKRLLRLVPGIQIGNGRADVIVECTELAYIFRTTVNTIPADVPYVHLPAVRASRNGRLRVGLVWSSGVFNPLRSVPLADLAPLASIPGVSWTPLQHGPAFSDARTHGQPFGFSAAPDPTGADALDTAMRMLNLDLVITPDTMVAHLAGAVGLRTWILLPYDADWRWLRHGEHSPWYPTARLFRQRRPGDWAEAVAEVCAALRNAAVPQALS
jgi:hypothetical protein